MGLTCDQLPPSEALPDIGVHCVVYHNGRGYYYVCKDYLSPLDKRVFECVRPECRVTARMGSGLGSPLIDEGSHSHCADLAYRDKCIVLHTIKQRFLQDIEASASFILEDVLSSISPQEDCSASCKFESITLSEDRSFPLFQEEATANPIGVEDDRLSAEVDPPSVCLQPVKTYGKHAKKPGPSTSSLLPIDFVEVKTEEVDLGIDMDSMQDPENPDEDEEEIDEDGESSHNSVKQRRKDLLNSRTELDLPSKSDNALFNSDVEESDSSNSAPSQKKRKLALKVREDLGSHEEQEPPTKAPENIVPDCVLEKTAKKKKKVQPLPCDEIRKASVRHMPEIPSGNKSHRCRLPTCNSTKARILCTTCKIYLCITQARNCFKLFHEI